jgi:signal peptidase I
MYNEDLIKRIIGLPGDTVYCEDGKIYVNDELLDESYSDGKTNDFASVTLKEDEYFVLGDNRDDSFDSSEFGVIKKSQIKGKTSLVLFPFNKIGNIEK